MENGASYSTPEIDFNFAFRICLAIGVSVRSMTTPPDELMKGLNLLIPWNSSNELSGRIPPRALEASFQNILTRFQPLEKEIAQKKEELKKDQGNFLKNFLFRRKIKASLGDFEHSVKRTREEFENVVEVFINEYQHEYQQYVDWYYWGEKGALSIWRLIDLFKNNGEESSREREILLAKIREKTFNELIELKKQGINWCYKGEILR